MEEEYSRRIEEIKRKKLEGFNGKEEQGKGKGQPESSSHVKVNLPASEGREQLERTEAERNGNTYVIADFDWLDHDTKPEIYEQFTIMMSKGDLSFDCRNFFVTLQVSTLLKDLDLSSALVFT